MSIELIEPQAAEELEFRIEGEDSRRILLSPFDDTAHLFLMGTGFSSGICLKANAARELAAALLLCADAVEGV